MIACGINTGHDWTRWVRRYYKEREDGESEDSAREDSEPKNEGWRDKTQAYPRIIPAYRRSVELIKKTKRL